MLSLAGKLKLLHCSAKFVVQGKLQKGNCYKLVKVYLS